MAAAVEISQSSIVGVGDFNPSIFTPDWLELHKLIGSADADAARNDENFIASRQATRFGTDWFDMQVLLNQFSLTSKGPLTPAIKDLGVGILTLVCHTPITAIGLNFMAHYKMGNANDCHVIGDKLAPKVVWNKLFPANDISVGLANLNMTVAPCKRGENPRDGNRTRIAVQPSARVKDGVFLSVNNHYEIENVKEQHRTAGQIAVSLIEENWETEWRSSITLFDEIIKYGLET